MPASTPSCIQGAQIPLLRDMPAAPTSLPWSPVLNSTHDSHPAICPWSSKRNLIIQKWVLWFHQTFLLHHGRSANTITSIHNVSWLLGLLRSTILRTRLFTAMNAFKALCFYSSHIWHYNSACFKYVVLLIPLLCLLLYPHICLKLSYSTVGVPVTPSSDAVSALPWLAIVPLPTPAATSRNAHGMWGEVL